MIPRRVIADSEDEDEEEDELVTYPEGECDPPELEELSPHHRPSSPVAPATYNQPSTITDPSFFAEVYTNQQGFAIQQSYLIENIVRQSQKVSASSGDVSLPSVKQGEKASFSTDVTTPLILSRAQKNRVLISDGASDFTTPRNSKGQEWEVPSSAEDNNSRDRIYGRSKRSTSSVFSAPVAAESFESGRAIQKPLIEDRTSPMSMPAAKRTKLSHDDSVLSDSVNFYITQSSLTTMQKLEYQKVNMSINGYGGLPGLPSNQKSSYATTIPYSTPSGFSSVPPWEEHSTSAGPQPNNIIYISSSPDEIASGSNSPNKTRLASSEIEGFVPNKTSESRSRSRHQTPAIKGKEAVANDVEEDELGRDNTWDLSDPDLPRECYRPRPSKRRMTTAASFSKVGDDTDDPEEVSIEAAIQTPGVSRSPAPVSQEIDPLELPPEVLPKRGRKKNLTLDESPSTGVEATELSHSERNPDNRNKDSEAGHSKAKLKKRGSSLKTETPKSTKGTLSEPSMARERSYSPEQDDDTDGSDMIVKRGKRANAKNRVMKDVKATKRTTQQPERSSSPEQEDDTDGSDRIIERGRKANSTKNKTAKNVGVTKEAVQQPERFSSPEQDNDTDASDIMIKRGRKASAKKNKTVKGVVATKGTTKEPHMPSSPEQDDDTDGSDMIIDRGRKATVNKKKMKDAEATKGTKPKENKLLREVNGNTKNTLSEKKVGSGPDTLSSEVASDGQRPSEVVEPKDEKSVAEKQSIEPTRLPVTQTKATYRVGLSKRSRIAPLLKTIRK